MPHQTSTRPRPFHHQTNYPTENQYDMAIVKIIEVIASSPNSFDEATQNALKEASKSVNNIKSIYVKEMNANVEDGKIVSYGVNAKVSFMVDN
jgi:flavin-binding protein dodecin